MAVRWDDPATGAVAGDGVLLVLELVLALVPEALVTLILVLVVMGVLMLVASVGACRGWC